MCVCLVGGGLVGQEPYDALQGIDREVNAVDGKQRLVTVTFRSLKQVSLSTNIIRLGDVVEPLDPDLPGWAEMSRLGIGLVPIDGTEMIVERLRLENLIHNGQKRSCLINWIGPTRIRVCYQPHSASGMRQASASGVRQASASGVAQTQMHVGRNSEYPTRRTAASLLTHSSSPLQDRTSRGIAGSDPVRLNTLIRWIEAAFSKSVQGGFQYYGVELVEIEKFRPTRRPLDIAILGSGYVQVTGPGNAGTMYVKPGPLDINVNGNLVMRSGQTEHCLDPPINIPPDAETLVIHPDGVVQVQLPGATQLVSQGKIEVSSTGKPNGVLGQREPVSLVNATTEIASNPDASGQLSWQILQGFLEAPQSNALQDLHSISGVDVVTPLEGLHEGLCRFRLQGRGLDGPVDVVVGLELTAKPVVAAPSKSLPRGHRLSLEDLHLLPIDEEDVDSKHFTSLEKLVGMEVHQSLRVNRPVLESDVRKPTLVRRGDLLDLRVVAAGIVVTTAAKALADGPLNELIEVEIMRPRKRKVARVVGPGVVEILSRPPQVASLLKERRK